MLLSGLLVAEVSSMDVESGEGAVDRRRGTELHVMAEVVPSLLAEGAHSTGHAWLYGNAVAWRQTRTTLNLLTWGS